VRIRQVVAVVAAAVCRNGIAARGQEQKEGAGSYEVSGPGPSPLQAEVVMARVVRQHVPPGVLVGRWRCVVQWCSAVQAGER